WLWLPESNCWLSKVMTSLPRASITLIDTSTCLSRRNERLIWSATGFGNILTLLISLSCGPDEREGKNCRNGEKIDHESRGLSCCDATTEEDMLRADTSPAWVETKERTNIASKARCKTFFIRCYLT